MKWKIERKIELVIETLYKWVYERGDTINHLDLDRGKIYQIILQDKNYVGSINIGTLETGSGGFYQIYLFWGWRIKKSITLDKYIGKGLICESYEVEITEENR